MWWNFGDVLDLEGVDGDSMLGKNEPKEASVVKQNMHLRGFKQILY
jgi:hypothetical protein